MPDWLRRLLKSLALGLLACALLRHMRRRPQEPRPQAPRTHLPRTRELPPRAPARSAEETEDLGFLDDLGPNGDHALPTACADEAEEPEASHDSLVDARERRVWRARRTGVPEVPEDWLGDPEDRQDRLTDGARERRAWWALPTDVADDPQDRQDRLAGWSDARQGRARVAAARAIDDWVARDAGPAAHAACAEASAPVLLLKDPERPRLGRATALLRAARRMFIDRWEMVELRIRPGALLTSTARMDLERTFLATTQPADPDSVRTDTIDIWDFGRCMTAHLRGTGEMFRIKDVTHHATQDLRAGRPMIWNWEVLPRRTGAGVLRVDLSVQRDLDGRTFRIPAPVLEVEIDVVVGSRVAYWWRWMRRNWVWGTIFAAAGALVPLIPLLIALSAPSGDAGPSPAGPQDPPAQQQALPPS